ncbi:hypothetical protein DFA_01807 [Cavenderia fasciculata]|uniref:Saposin B-type domain-containing protein n=1 Tax=Cavenderia fasciculata TaxID=261658 RepID=F4PUV9_CACFS|nr:uncharacterized protein DFA_01807 [Cavenderia fasciculata]EGG21921.1 hypothetical protein DFA_01807 [Cavenderia fasciculata]|eukprot:XP_004359772.1 hypothetical protein DFA_01807 [Cavenderia fasciculata]
MKLVAIIICIVLCITATVVKSDQELSYLDGVNCSICEVLVARASAVLKKEFGNSSQVLAFMDKECAHLGRLDHSCVDLVNQYGPLIMNFITVNGQPLTLCEMVGLCPPPPKPHFKDQNPMSIEAAKSDLLTKNKKKNTDQEEVEQVEVAPVKKEEVVTKGKKHSHKKHDNLKIKHTHHQATWGNK